MLDRTFLKQAEELARVQSDEYHIPAWQVIELANKKGQQLAEKLGADKDIVLAGTLLMDCQLGPAMQAGDVGQHTVLAAKRARELFAESPEIDIQTQDKIIACIMEHHGVETFSCIESEICCNADCYRFLSVEGFLLSVRYLRDMPFESLIKILRDKAAEKRQALSLPVCVQELAGDIDSIKELLDRMPVAGSHK